MNAVGPVRLFVRFLYELSPCKHKCLPSCVSPAAFCSRAGLTYQAPPVGKETWRTELVSTALSWALPRQLATWKARSVRPED